MKQTILPNDLNLTKIKRFPNSNHRPQTKYFTAITPNGDPVHVKVTTDRSNNYEKIYPITCNLYRMGYPLPEPLGFYQVKNNQIIITRLLSGKSIQKKQYNPVNVSDQNSLIDFVTNYFLNLKPFSSIKIQSEFNHLNSEFFKNKLTGYLEKLNASNIFPQIKEAVSLIGKSFYLSPQEYSLQHGDLYCCNIIYNPKDKSYYLIDWDGVCHTSKYFDIATFIAKDLHYPSLVNQIYSNIGKGLSNKEKSNLNSQIIIALIKEYKNLFTLDEATIKIVHLAKYKKLLEEKLPQIIDRYSKSINANILFNFRK